MGVRSKALGVRSEYYEKLALDLVLAVGDVGHGGKTLP